MNDCNADREYDLREWEDRLDIRSNAAKITSPSSRVAQMTSLETLKSSSPSYPRARFLPFLLLLPKPVAVPSTSDCAASTVDRDGRIALINRVGTKGVCREWHSLRSTTRHWRNASRCDLSWSV